MNKILLNKFLRARQPFHRIAPCRLKVDYEQRGTTCVALLKHLDIANVLSGGNEVILDPTAIFKLSEHTYCPRESITRQLFYEHGGVSFNMFMKWKQIQCHPALYNKTSDTEPASVVDFVNQEIEITNFPQPIKNKSQEFFIVMKDNATKRVLISQRDIFVNVNMSTLKPAPYADHCKELFNDTTCDKGPEIHDQVEKRCRSVTECPQNTLYTKYDTVSARQIDFQGHLNQGHYVDFVFDCLAEAMLKGVVHGISSVFERRIKTISVLYVRESKFGDELNTTVWRDDSDSMMFKFHVRRDSELICQAEISLY